MADAPPHRAVCRPLEHASPEEGLHIPTATLSDLCVTLPLIAKKRGDIVVGRAEQAVGLVAISSWLEALDDVHRRIAHRFRRIEVRERLRRYLVGLLDQVERKNGWQLAEAIGEVGPQGVQRLLNAAMWDADGVRDDLRGYIVDHLGDAPSGVLIVDETGFLKQGTKSCGAARQYTGTAGDTVNAQVGVFLAYASAKGVAFIDRALYLPREWTSDPCRRAEAGIPKGVRFATKLALAQRMLARAFDADTPARWVVADSGYGRSHGFRQWLEKRGRAYAVMIPKTNALQYRGRRERAEQLGARLTEDHWIPLAAGTGAQGERVHDWACLPLSDRCPVAMCRWLLIRRDPHDPSAHAYWLACGPVETTVAQLVGVCATRWAIEECFAQTKGELGMDQYEVRKWEAWHRFVTLCLLAHAYLVVMRSAAQQEEVEEKGAQIAA